MDHFHHHVDVVAVYAVYSHSDDVDHFRLMLDIPGEAQDSETMEERRQSTGPIAVMHIDDVDA